MISQQYSSIWFNGFKTITEEDETDKVLQPSQANSHDEDNVEETMETDDLSKSLGRSQDYSLFEEDPAEHQSDPYFDPNTTDEGNKDFDDYNSETSDDDNENVAAPGEPNVEAIPYLGLQEKSMNNLVVEVLLKSMNMQLQILIEVVSENVMRHHGNETNVEIVV